MCGIVGFIEESPDIRKNGKRDFLTQALYVDTLRGHDSTGVITVSNNFDVQTAKDQISGPEFISAPQYMGLDLDSTWCAIGHNRAATRGKVVKRHAHPFTFGPVALVHNGTLQNMGSNLEYKVPSSYKIGVDSAVIAYNLSKAPPEGAKEVLEQIRGSYALVWTDSRDSSINIARNNDRPLHFGMTAGDKGMYFMSDGMMLHMLTQRKYTQIPSLQKIYSFADKQHLKFKRGEMVPEVATIRPFHHHAMGTTAGWWPKNNYQSGRGFKTGTKGTSSTKKYDTKIHRFRNTKTKVGHVKINGEMRTIPEQHVKQLEKTFQLKIDEVLPFRPKKFTAGRTSNQGMVTGTILHPVWDFEIDAQLYNIYWDSFNNFKDTIWEVAPIGMQFSTPQRANDAVVLTRLVSHYSSDQKVFEDLEDSVELYEGPDRKLYTEEEWERVAGDCANCSSPLFASQAPEVLWDGYFAFCADCAEELTENENDKN
jgi:hypothetical protein